jgi:hypothetical protein
MRGTEIELHVGRHRVTTIAIMASSLPPVWRLSLFYGMTTSFSKLSDTEALASIPEKVAIFERMDYTRKYYLTEVV